MGERSQSSGVFRFRFESGFDWLAVLLGVVLAGIHLYLGVVENEPPFLVVAIGFLGGVFLFLTRYWQPILYLLAALFVLVLGTVWLLGGMEYRTLGLVTGAISTAFILVVAYLFLREVGLSEELSKQTR